MTDTKDLIARLESATGPDRELDNALMMIQHDWKRRKLSAVANHREWCWVNRKTNRWRTTARDGFTFTASIDAALTLCGGESGLGSLIAGNFPDGTRGWVARVRSPATADGEGKTPALALCIAALRARND